MKLTDLIEQLERLDAAATPGPWTGSKYFAPTFSVVDTQNVYGRPPNAVVAKVVRASQDGIYSAERLANASLIEMIGTHRAAILAHLKRLAELDGQRSHAGSKENER